MKKTEFNNRKSMIIRESGRSTDFLSPSFIMGCGFECTYCYCKRHKPTGLDIATNIGDILTAINSHSWFAQVEKPNQTHEKFITYDIGCNTDVALHYKQMHYEDVFNFFKEHPLAMGSFATKYVNENLLKYNPEGKIRIRFSLMPQKYSDLLEPNTSLITDRIKAINDFISAGYDVHINFSPVIVENGWLEEYKMLFEEVNSLIDDKYKDRVKAEVIFLTHNKDKHKYNVINKLSGEELLWKPHIQEDKVSQYGGNNLRYVASFKSAYINQFKEFHNSIIPWNTIRYIF